MEGCFTFQWGFVFQMGASFLSWGCAQWGGMGFDGGFLKKIVGWEGVPPMPPTIGNPEIPHPTHITPIHIVYFQPHPYYTRQGFQACSLLVRDRGHLPGKKKILYIV